MSSAASARADDPASASRTALVVRGGWEGHQPVEATDLFVPHLERAGFTVRIEDGPAIYADAAVMASVDLIVQCVTMSSITAEQVAGLRAAVAAGTGLAGWHGGIADSYRESSDYLQLIGGQFACHPAKAPGEEVAGEPDTFVRHTIAMTPAAAEHPITHGIGDFTLTSEQYWVLSDDYNDVLATTTQAVREGDAWQRPVTSPALWTRQWGAGRIAVLTAGHDLDVLRHDSVRTLVERSLLWAAR